MEQLPPAPVVGSLLPKTENPSPPPPVLAPSDMPVNTSAVLGWPKNPATGSGQSSQNYTGKYLTSNNILNVTVNRSINL